MTELMVSDVFNRAALGEGIVFVLQLLTPLVPFMHASTDCFFHMFLFVFEDAMVTMKNWKVFTKK